jgi:uncharacterized membrane protein
MEGVWQVLLYLHVLAMAFFVGGQLLIAAAVVPVERTNPDRDRLRQIARRFGYGTLIALAVLLATGAAMASHLDLWGSDLLRAKLVVVAIVLVLAVAHLRYPRAHVLQALIFLGSLAIVWLGVDLGS